MILLYCKICDYHEAVVIYGTEHSRCLKENCLSVYTKCLTEEAVRRFIHENKYENIEKLKSALEVCYPIY